MWGVKRKVWRVKCKVWGLKRGVWIVKCGVWSVGTIEYCMYVNSIPSIEICGG